MPPRPRIAASTLAEVSSLAKWTASDTAMRVATDAVQLFGGDAATRARPAIERLMRDAKGAQIYEGTNQIHREIVAGEVLKRARGTLGGGSASGSTARGARRRRHRQRRRCGRRR